MTASGWAGITTDEDTAYLAFSSHIVAVNLTNGTERWRFPKEADSSGWKARKQEQNRGRGLRKEC